MGDGPDRGRVLQLPEKPFLEVQRRDIQVCQNCPDSEKKILRSRAWNWIELCLENILKYRRTIGKPEGFDLIQHDLDGDLTLNLCLNSRKIINSLKSWFNISKDSFLGFDSYKQIPKGLITLEL